MKITQKAKSKTLELLIFHSQKKDYSEYLVSRIWDNKGQLNGKSKKSAFKFSSN